MLLRVYIIHATVKKLSIATVDRRYYYLHILHGRPFENSQCFLRTVHMMCTHDQSLMENVLYHININVY